MANNGAQPLLTLRDDAVIVQHDWQLGFKDVISKFFIGVKPAGDDKTQYFDVQVTLLIDEYSFTVLPGDGTIKSTELSLHINDHRHLVITYKGRSTIFVAPMSEQIVPCFKSAPQCIDLSKTKVSYVAGDANGHLVVHDAWNDRTVVELTGQVMDIYRCIFTPLGEIVLAGGMDMAIRIWTSDYGVHLRTLHGHTQAVTGLGVLGYEKDFVSCSNDGTARIWNGDKDETLDVFNFDAGKCLDLCTAPDGSKFAVMCETNVLCIVNLRNGKSRHTIKLPSEPTAICMSPDTGEIVYVGFADGHVAAYNTLDFRIIGEVYMQRGSVTCIKHCLTRLFVSFNSGAVITFQIPILENLAACVASMAPEDVIRKEYELTGPDCQPVYGIGVVKDHVVSCCRDNYVRLYRISNP